MQGYARLRYDTILFSFQQDLVCNAFQKRGVDSMNWSKPTIYQLEPTQNTTHVASHESIYYVYDEFNCIALEE